MCIRDRHKKALIENHMASSNEVEIIQDEVNASIEDALQFARESPYPEAKDLYTDMYADPISGY